MKKKSYSKLNLFMRSLIFTIVSVTTMSLYSFVCLLTFPFNVRYRIAVICIYLRFFFYLLRIICHIDYKVEGLEHIPKESTGIIMSKHQSTWETFFIPLIFPNLAPIIKRELLWIPFFGWGLALALPIAINRNKKASAMQQIIQKGKKCLEEGRWIMFFPEGTRVPPGVVGQYKLGGARLATATGYPVIPIAHNAGYFWPRRQFIKQPGTIHMVIGPLIQSEGKQPEEILASVKEWIETTMIRIIPNCKN
jgi:1-acyl-sn-glycerol-3-phosphate acyltransferase